MNNKPAINFFYIVLAVIIVMALCLPIFYKKSNYFLFKEMRLYKELRQEFATLTKPLDDHGFRQKIQNFARQKGIYLDFKNIYSTYHAHGKRWGYIVYYSNALFTLPIVRVFETNGTIAINPNR